MSDGFRVASSVLDIFLKAREEPIADPLETIRKIAEARQFSQKLTDEVTSSFLIEAEANRFGLINAFTHAAQQLGPLQRIEMERFAGTLVGNSFRLGLCSKFRQANELAFFLFANEPD